MNKDKEIMDFLHEKVFDPILKDDSCDKDIKKGVKCTIMRMNKLDASGKIKYFWSAIVGTEKSIPFAEKIKKSGLTRFEDVLEEFRVKFDDKWLRS